MNYFTRQFYDVDFIIISYIDDLELVRLVCKHLYQIIERISKARLKELLGFHKRRLGLEGQYFLAHRRFHLANEKIQDDWSPQSRGDDEDSIVNCACQFGYGRILIGHFSDAGSMYYYHTSFSRKTLISIRDLIAEKYPKSFRKFLYWVGNFKNVQKMGWLDQYGITKCWDYDTWS